MKGADLFTGQSVPKEYRLTMEGRALDAVLRPYSSQMHDYTQPLIKNHLFTKGFPGMTQIAVLTWSLVNKYDGQDQRVNNPKYVMPKAEKEAMQASLKSAFFKAVAGCIDPDDGHRACGRDGPRSPLRDRARRLGRRHRHGLRQRRCFRGV